jgi:hypothetical protein
MLRHTFFIELSSRRRRYCVGSNSVRSAESVVLWQQRKKRPTLGAIEVPSFVARLTLVNVMKIKAVLWMHASGISTKIEVEEQGFFTYSRSLEMRTRNPTS